MVRMSCVSHDLRFRNPCWESVRMPFLSKWDMTLVWMTCSKTLHTIDVNEMGTRQLTDTVFETIHRQILRQFADTSEDNSHF